jgi:GcrA cell cycle regulator
MSALQPTWTIERVELLKTHFRAGLSCREIADQIGVSRNAVIGKISRLNLTRERAGATRRQAVRGPRKRAGLRLRRQILEAVPVKETAALEEPIHNGHCCSLFELSEQTCRWPISTPGLSDFRFCGNPPVEGLPYCVGHSRLAYSWVRANDRK